MGIEILDKVKETEKAGLELPPRLAAYKVLRFRESFRLAQAMRLPHYIYTALAAQAIYLDCVSPNPVNVVLHGR